MKQIDRIAFFLCLGYMSCASVPQNISGIPDENSQKRIEVTGPKMAAVIEYMGGDTLYIYVVNKDGEKMQLKLLEGNATLLVDKLEPLKEQQRFYILSQFPQGQYRVRFKKGNYVVERSIVKYKSQMPLSE
jgi:hypothetical protein